MVIFEESMQSEKSKKKKKERKKRTGQKKIHLPIVYLLIEFVYGY